MKATLLCNLSLFLLVACNAPNNEAAQKIKPVDSIAVVTIDSAQQKAVVTQTYVSAIDEYLKTVYKKDKSAPDTLFIGKHPDFPNIILPNIIQNTKIYMLTLDEAYLKQNKKNYLYLKVISTYFPDKVEFILVAFKQGGKPQHNCTIDLDLNNFKLKQIRFEDYPINNRFNVKETGY